MSEEADIEERVFELLGKYASTAKIAGELRMPVEDVLPIVLKVIEERGTPNLAAARRAIDHLATIRVV